MRYFFLHHILAIPSMRTLRTPSTLIKYQSSIQITIKTFLKMLSNLFMIRWMVSSIHFSRITFYIAFLKVESDAVLPTEAPPTTSPETTTTSTTTSAAPRHAMRRMTKERRGMMEEPIFRPDSARDPQFMYRGRKKRSAPIPPFVQKNRL